MKTRVSAVAPVAATMNTEVRSAARDRMVHRGE
jgi:hypothetical protein